MGKAVWEKEAVKAVKDVSFRGLLDFLKERGYHVGKDQYQLEYVTAMFNALQENKEGSSNSLFIDAEAGTGKTTLASLVGAWAVMGEKVEKILYIRTEDDILGGKERGALPGDDDEKNAPYKAAFVEALDEVQPGLYEKWSRMQEELEQMRMYGKANKIQIQKKAKAIATHPGHFRGKTRGKMFVILDEAQNWRRSQLQAIYTRFKNDAVIVTIGHSGQCDIPKNQRELVAGYLPFNLFAIHHSKKGAWVGTLQTNYRGEFAKWSDKLEITIKELLSREVK